MILQENSVNICLLISLLSALLFGNQTIENYNTERTYTVYNTALTIPLTYQGNKTQRYTQNRVSYTYNDDSVFTYFSYDPHGNVEWLIQDLPNLGKKYIRYEYDLISNKVLAVHYHEGTVDEFHHRYSYDADQRILTAQTAWGPGAVSLSLSKTGGSVGWDKDATCKYYKHGPLKRMELGEDNIQGVDYVYTLQGWLKGINHPSLSVANDPGGSTDNDITFSRDAFGMVLGYDSLDFKRTGSPFNSLTASLISSQSGGLTNLYNGNISSWTLQTDTISGNYAGQMGFKYRYDQLNRIKGEDYNSYASSTWSASTNYDSRYTYDANGNITALTRNGSGTAMDDMNYQYETVANGYGTNTNKLRSVDDVVSAGNYATDIDDQNLGNYKYDAIGNLVEDVQGSIDTILWTVYGKVKQVKKTNGDKIEFRYDAGGNRVSKTVTPHATGIALATYYVRDASGNDMSIYEGRNSGHNYAYTLKENPIFGSDRIGTYKPDKLVKTDNNFCFTGAIYYSSMDVGHSSGLYGRSVGKKEYELSDHLGNIRVMVGDRKLSNGKFAEIKSYSNYYAGGMPMPGRQFNPTSYRFGYNGMEKVDEWNGVTGGHYTAEFWEYDSRLNWRQNPDPVVNPGESPYATFHGNPILNADPNGDTPTNFEDTEGNTIKHVEDGSNAKFQLTGTGPSDDYFKFTGYDKTQGGKNVVNLESVLDFTQDYTRENYKSTFNGYKKDDKGNPTTNASWTTYCNFGTRGIAKSYASGLDAMGVKLDVKGFDGSAENIFNNLKTSSFKPLTREEAQKEAKAGSFVVGGWKSHAFTLNKEGIINNVGAPRKSNNLWDPQYGLPKTNQFYLIYKPIITN